MNIQTQGILCNDFRWLGKAETENQAGRSDGNTNQV